VTLLKSQWLGRGPRKSPSDTLAGNCRCRRRDNPRLPARRACCRCSSRCDRLIDETGEWEVTVRPYTPRAARRSCSCPKGGSTAPLGADLGGAHGVSA